VVNFVKFMKSDNEFMPRGGENPPPLPEKVAKRKKPSPLCPARSREGRARKALIKRL
jgi:hypothetical protein